MPPIKYEQWRKALDNNLQADLGLSLERLKGLVDDGDLRGWYNDALSFDIIAETIGDIVRL